MVLRRTSTLYILGTTKFLSMNVESERPRFVVTFKRLGITFKCNSINILFVEQVFYDIIY